MSLLFIQNTERTRGGQMEICAPGEQTVGQCVVSLDLVAPSDLSLTKRNKTS